MIDRTKRAWINGIFLVITLGINSMGALGWINGNSQKEISDRYVTLITPSPSTFSIWSLIYALLLMSVVVMIAKKDDPYYHRAIDQITVMFRVSCLLNILWIVSFSYVQIELSVLFIFALLITLTIICKRLTQIQEKKHWLLPISFGLYTGWLLIATVVNIAAALVKLKWSGFGIGQETWAVIVLVGAIMVAFYVLLKIRNAAFLLPIAWAYWGIYQFLNSSEGFGGEFPLLQGISLAGMIVLIAIAAIQLYKNKLAIVPNNLS